jgi:Tol biopolymer transport system component
MNIDGSDVVRLTDNEERDDFPSWHPDGNRIVYVSERDGQKDIYQVAISKPIKVTAK